MEATAIDVKSRALIQTARLELIPLKSVEKAIAALPPQSNVSVTCSPAKGLQATIDLTVRLLDLGHRPVPHISARLVESRVHTERLARRLREYSIEEIFLIAGDTDQPVGPYDDTLGFLRDFLEEGSGVRHVGVTSYPDGHPLISPETCREALFAKQSLLAAAGVEAHATTQMCFDADKVRRWINDQRAYGLTLPVHLGLPGVVDKTRLLTLGLRLGIGQSLRFVRKNRNSVRGLLSPGGYDPSTLVDEFAGDAGLLNITGLHLFTFNEVETTVEWQRRELRMD